MTCDTDRLAQESRIYTYFINWHSLPERFATPELGQCSCILGSQPIIHQLCAVPPTYALIVAHQAMYGKGQSWLLAVSTTCSTFWEALINLWCCHVEGYSSNSSLPYWGLVTPARPSNFRRGRMNHSVTVAGGLQWCIDSLYIYILSGCELRLPTAVADYFKAVERAVCFRHRLTSFTNFLNCLLAITFCALFCGCCNNYKPLLFLLK